MRVRDEVFAAMVVNRLEDGRELLDAAREAVPMVWSQRKKPEVVDRWAKTKLRQHDVQRAIQAEYEERTGFTLDEALALQVRHIRGDVTKEVITRDGIAKVRLAPDKAMLGRYLDAVLPKAPTEVNVQRESVSANVEATLDLNRVPDYNLRRFPTPHQANGFEDDGAVITFDEDD